MLRCRAIAHIRVKAGLYLVPQFAWENRLVLAVTYPRLNRINDVLVNVRISGGPMR